MAGRIIGGILGALGVLISATTLISAAIKAFQKWTDQEPDFGLYYFGCPDFFVLYGARLILGFGLIGIGVFFFRGPPTN